MFLSVNTFSQIIFEKNYGNAPNFEETNSIIHHEDVVVLAGYTTFQTNGGDDVLLVKLDTLGNLIWKKNIGSIKNEQANKIRLLDDGYLIAGHTKSIGNGNQDFYLVKTDFEGNVLWEQSYGTANLENCVDVIETADDGFMLLGTAVTNVTNGEDWWVLKTDSDGNEEWSSYYGLEDRDIPTIIKPLSDGNYLIGGAFGFYLKILKIDINGTLIWDYSGGTSLHGARDILELNNNDLLVSEWRGTIKKLTSEGDELYSQQHVSMIGLTVSSTAYKFQPINEDSMLSLNQFYSFAINPENGDTLANLGWDDPDELYSNWNDLLCTDDHYFVAADHFSYMDASFFHNGILMQKFDSNRVELTHYIDTFEFNTYKEYAREVIEMPSGDFLLFGLREKTYLNSDHRILLTRTAADGAFISEMTFNKGYEAKPIDMFYTDLGNTILLTQINADTMELSMVNTNGQTLWTQIFPGSYDINESGEIGIIKKYPDDQYLLVLNGREFHIFNEAGTLNMSHQNNAPVTGLPVDLTVLPDGEVIYVTGHRMVLLGSDASWSSTIDLTPAGYSNVNYFGYVFNSEEEIWLAGTTKIVGTDSLKFVIMKTNLDGQRLLETIFGGIQEEELPDLKLLRAEGDHLLVYGNRERPWEYQYTGNLGYNVDQINCLTKPLHTALLEEWQSDGELLSQINFGIGQGANISNMIICADDNIAGAGWIYDTNSDDQYLVKIDQGLFIPTINPGFKNKGQLLVFPNPGNASINYHLNVQKAGQLQINIFDVTGRLVFTQQKDKTDHQIEMQLDTGLLPEGLYFLQSTVDGELISIDQWVKIQTE